MLLRRVISLLVTLFVVSLVVWLLIWYTRPPAGGLILDCAAKDADGNWHFGSCE
jgi:hypothetical protein